MRVAADRLAQFMSQMTGTLGVADQRAREERLRAAPEVLRRIVAPQLDNDGRALIWGLANDLEEFVKVHGVFGDESCD